MKIDTAKQLEQVIKLCRKLGVDSMRIDGVEFHLAPIALQPKKVKSLMEDIQPQMPVYTPGGITEEVTIPTDGLTEEQLLFYSAQPLGEQPQ
jgi:hypothetical protein